MVDERSDLMRRVGRALTLPPELSGLTVRRADGTRPIVGALSSDLVGDVVARVRESGGAANVVVSDGSHLVVLAIRHGARPLSEDDVPVHQDVTMGMLIALVSDHRQEAAVTLGSDDVALIGLPHPLLAPA